MIHIFTCWALHDDIAAIKYKYNYASICDILCILAQWIIKYMYINGIPLNNFSEIDIQFYTYVYMFPVKSRKCSTVHVLAWLWRNTCGSLPDCGDWKTRRLSGKWSRWLKMWDCPTRGKNSHPLSQVKKNSTINVWVVGFKGKVSRTRLGSSYHSTVRKISLHL